MARLGLALYSVRRACAEDFAGTLRAVAGLGFEGVELADLHGQDAAAVGGWLSELGLEACGRHVRLEAMEADLAGVVEESRALGVSRLVVPWIDPDRLGDELAQRLAAVSDAVAVTGMQLGYHNHDAEVRSGFLDTLPAAVFLELDAGWAWWAGADPVDLLGRGPLVHIKDFRTRGERSFCPVGDGAVGFDRVAPAAAAAGAEWLLVEQDEPTDGELADAERSLGALRRMLAAA